MNTWGIVNSYGVFQPYYTTTLSRPPSDIAWIGSFEVFLLFFIGAFTGRLTDAGYFRPLFIAGFILVVLGMVTTSFCTQYWQFFLAQGICMGLGNGFLFCPSLSTASTYFDKKKALALGFVSIGSSTGGMIYPSMVRQLLPKIGFGWTIRAIALVQMVTLLVTSLILKPRIKPRKAGSLVEWAAFKELEYSFYALGSWLNYLGVFFASYYIASYSRDIVGLSYTSSLNLLLLLNGTGVPGRLIPAYFASYYIGTVNMFIPMSFISGIMMLCWPAVSSVTGLYVWTTFYGFFTGAIQSLMPSGIGTLTADPRKQGTRMGMTFTLISFAVLIGQPIAGAIISAEGGKYTGAQAYAGASSRAERLQTPKMEPAAVNDALFNHLVLPAQLPQRQEHDRQLRLVEGALLERLIGAATIMSGSEADNPSHGHWQSLRQTLIACQHVNRAGRIDKSSLVRRFQNLDPSGCLILHVESQNAGLIVRRAQDPIFKDCVVFEAFEASPRNEDVLAAKAALVWDFPGIAVAVPYTTFSDDDFQTSVASFIEQASLENTKTFAAHTFKAGAIVYEYRNTGDPSIITSMLMAILEENGRRIAPTLLRKRVRDDVCWNRAEKPWRRLPLWLVIRVGIQRYLSMALDAESGRLEYKFYIAVVLSKFLDEAPSYNIGIERVHFLKKKICRRLVKLDLDKQRCVNDSIVSRYGFLFDFLGPKFNKSIENCNRVLNVALAQERASLHKHIPLLPRKAADADLRLSLRISRAHLHNALERFKMPRHRPRQQTRPNEGLAEAAKDHLSHYAQSYHKLIDRELELSHLPGETCSEIAKRITDYANMAVPLYEGNPEQKSQMILTIMEMWQRMDAIACHWFPLLQEFHPVLHPQMLDVLLLPQYTDMARLNTLQLLLSDRVKRANSERRNIFEDPSPGCFGERHYSESADAYNLKQLHESIVEVADDLRASKESEWKKKSQRCSKMWSAQKMRIAIFEDLLPSDPVVTRATVFELACPKEFAVYRETTWWILRQLAAPFNDEGNPPRCLLKDNLQLKPFFEPNRSKVGLASTTKPFVVSHYYTLHSSPFSKLFEQRSFAPGAPGPSSYEIMASQSSCPAGVNVHEYLAMQTLMSGKAQRWLALLTELGSTNLNFSSEVTLLVVSNLVCQSGPADDDGISGNDTGGERGRDVLRKVHKIFREEQFCDRLVEQLIIRLDSLEANWRETYLMDVVITILLRTHTLTATNPNASLKALSALIRARQICLRWVEMLRAETYKESDTEAARRCQQYALWAAILCKRTFVIHRSQATLLDELSLQAYIECCITVQDNLVVEVGALPQVLQHAVVSDLKLSYRLASLVCASIIQSPDVFRLAIRAVWPEPEDRPRQIYNLCSQQPSWVACDIQENEEGNLVQVHYNYVQGLLLVDNKPLGKLPKAPEHIEVLNELFGDQALLTFPSTQKGMDYTLCLTPRNYRVDVGFEAGNMIVRATKGNQYLQLIPREVFRTETSWDLPGPLLDDCWHWLDLKSGKVFITHTTDIWNIHLRNWTLDVHRGVCQRSRGSAGYDKIVDTYSPLFNRVGRIFDGFEHKGQILVYQPASRHLEVEIRRLQLLFYVNPRQVLQSPQLGSEIDLDQDAGTWYGLCSKLVFRNPRDPSQRSILVPVGPFEARRIEGKDIMIARTHPTDMYGRFNINKSLGRLDCAAEPMLLYMKALLHAYTSSVFPDPLTGRTVFDELKVIELPMWEKYENFKPNQLPQLEQLMRIIALHKMPPPKDDGEELQQFASAKQLRKMREQRDAWERRSDEDCKYLANFLLAQWPCEGPGVAELAKSLLIDVGAALKLVRVEWKRLYQNMDLSIHLDAVQNVLDRRQSEVEYEAPVFIASEELFEERLRGGEILRLRTDLLQKTFPALQSIDPESRKPSNQPAKLATKTTPAANEARHPAHIRKPITLPSSNVRSTGTNVLAPSWMSSKTALIPSSDSTAELKQMVASFSKSPSMVRQKYGEDLQRSLDAFVTRKQPKESTNHEPTAFVAREASLSLMSIQRRFEKIQQALEKPDDTHSSQQLFWLKAGQLWPAITHVTLLEQLRSTAQPITFDWLLLEIEANLLIRPDQVDVALATISPASGNNSVLQMNMGQGKTSCIIPMVAAALANRQNLVRVVVPKALLLQTSQLLQGRLGGLLDRQVRHLPFSRRTPTEEHIIRAYHRVHRTMMKEAGVMYGLHPLRDPIAVPYHAKGVPSEQSEWGHPDVAILFTCLAFYYDGISVSQLTQSLEHLLKSDDPSAEYDKWTQTTESFPESLKAWNSINVDDDLQLVEIWKAVRYNMTTIDYFMNNFVFPQHAKQFRVKLQSNGWDIPLFTVDTPSSNNGDSQEISRALTTGFSGTNDNRTMLPLTIKQEDLPGLSHTNAEVLTYLLHKRSRECRKIEGSGGERATESDLLQELRRRDINILIDAGAQILEMDNVTLAKKWLEVDQRAFAALFFDEQNKPWVIQRTGRKTPLLASPYADDLSRCLVYLDEAHTRGTDLKFPPSARGALTLGLGQSKDHTVQAAMRLRQLGTTQSVTFFAPPEVYQSILDLQSKPLGATVDSHDVICWLLDNTCDGIEQLQPLYYAQGIDFCRRMQATVEHPEFLRDKAQREDYLATIKQNEQFSLQQMYEPKRKVKGTGEFRAGSNLKIRSFVKELNTRRKAFQDTGRAVHASALQEVEQEREVAFEVETVRQVKKPQHYPALSFPGLAQDIESFALNGRIPAGSQSFVPVLKSLAKTGTGKKFKVADRSTQARLFVSTEFERTIKLTFDLTNDNFLRNVNWILWSDVTGVALVVVPEEAEMLLPLIRNKGPKHMTHLILYSAPVTRKMLHFGKLDYLSIPPLAKDWEAPMWLRVELGLYAGRLYFEWDEYAEICRLLGIDETSLSEDMEESSDEDLERAQLDGAVESKPSAKPAKTGLTPRPLTFCQEWLAARRRGQDFVSTPMGFIAQGKPLQATHPFFRKTDTEKNDKLFVPISRQKVQQDADDQPLDDFGLDYMGENENADSDADDDEIEYNESEMGSDGEDPQVESDSEY
ncbi:hypothetical protein K4K60_013037 [Colletotrichum sp. SAR11_57]|nr:hypothetical protein K4K60_013037 [Colletotrichum sp. SAR11_57]